MNKNTKARILTLAAGTALFAVVGGGSAVAGSLVTSAQIKDNTIRSADVLNGGLRGVDVKDGSLRGVDLKNGSVGGGDLADGSVRGVDVADGTLTNADISVFHASVLANGTKDTASAGVSITKSGTGSYAVNFGRNVSGCSATATVGSTTSAVAVDGEADVTAQLLNPNAVHVYTRTAGTATNADLPFMVTLAC